MLSQLAKSKDDYVSDIFVNDINYHILNTDARVIIDLGGRDSGKSYFVGGQYIPLRMLKDKNFRGVSIRKTYASLKDSCYQEIVDGIETMGIENEFGMIKQPLEIEHKNGNKMLFRGLDNPTKIKSLKGINFIWVEEGEDLTRKEYNDLLILLRGKEKPTLIITFNPIDEEHFTKSDFVDIPNKNVLESFKDGDPKVWEIIISGETSGIKAEYKVLVLRTTFDDNTFIPPVRKLVIEQLQYTDPFLYQVYRKGKYGTKGGKILNNVKLLDMNELSFDNFDNKGYAQDFGYNHANCILSIAEKDNNLYIFDEIYVNEKSTDEIIELAKNLNKKLPMICDSAEPGTIKMWQKAGYKARGVKKFQGSVRTQINRLKKYNNIYVNITCVNTWKESKAYKWKQNKHGKYTDEPTDIFDDAMAALRYSTDLFEVKQKWGW